jgi:hypothetical protein
MPPNAGSVRQAARLSHDWKMTSSPGCVIERLADGTIRFSLTDPQISWLRIDYQARIQFGQAELVIETPFTLTVRGRSNRLDPNDRAGLGPFTALYPDTAADILMARNGDLGMTFASGTRLNVPPHPQYEAWSLGGFSCVPGGF